MPLIVVVPFERLGSLAGETPSVGSIALASVPLSIVAALPMPWASTVLLPMLALVVPSMVLTTTEAPMPLPALIAALSAPA